MAKSTRYDAGSVDVVVEMVLVASVPLEFSGDAHSILEKAKEDLNAVGCDADYETKSIRVREYEVEV